MAIYPTARRGLKYLMSGSKTFVRSFHGKAFSDFFRVIDVCLEVKNHYSIYVDFLDLVDEYASVRILG